MVMTLRGVRNIWVYATGEHDVPLGGLLLLHACSIHSQYTDTESIHAPVGGMREISLRQQQLLQCLARQFSSIGRKRLSKLPELHLSSKSLVLGGTVRGGKPKSGDAGLVWHIFLETAF